MKNIKTKLDVTEKDYKSLYIATYFANITKLLGILCSILLFAAVFMFYATTHSSFWLVVLSAVPLAFYVYTFVKVMPENAKNDYNGSSYKSRQPIFEMNDSGMISIEKSSGNMSDIRLSDLNAAWQKRNYFYFSITRNNTVILPKRLLNQEELAFVKAQLLTLARSKRRNPAVPSLRQFIVSVLTFIFITFCLIMVILSFTGKLA